MTDQMTPSTTADRITKLISELMGLDPSTITAVDTLEDLTFDSLDIVEVAMRVEEEFNIEVSYDDYEAWKTVQDVIAYVEEKTGVTV